MRGERANKCVNSADPRVDEAHFKNVHCRALPHATHSHHFQLNEYPLLAGRTFHRRRKKQSAPMGQNRIVWLFFEFAPGTLVDTPNAPKLTERAPARRSLQRRASFVAPGDKRPPASTTAVPFRMFDDVRKRSAPQAPKLAAGRAGSKGPSGKLAIRRERIAVRNCRRLTTPLLHSLYVNQLGRALPVVKDDAQQRRVQSMFLILISPVNHSAASLKVDFDRAIPHTEPRSQLPIASEWRRT